MVDKYLTDVTAKGGLRSGHETEAIALDSRSTQSAMDTAVDEAKERIKLKDQIAELKHDNTMLELKVSNLNYIISELRMEK